MKKAMKGLLWSALIFPGTGQLVLKQRKRGMVIILTTLTSISVIITGLVLTAMDVFAEVKPGSALDINTMNQMVNQAVTDSAHGLYNVMLVIFILCWLGGAIDAYRLGKKLDTLENK